MGRRFLCNISSHRILLLIFIAAFAIFPFLFYFATEATKNSSNQVVDWIPVDSQETTDFIAFLEHFPEVDFLMLSWDGATLDDERFDKIADRLLAPVDEEQNAFFSKVMTSRSVLEELMENELLNLTEEDAKSRMRGWMLGKNDCDACLVAVVSFYGAEHRTEAIETVYDTVQEITGLPLEQVQIAGTSTDSVAIDKISAESQKQLLPIFLMVCLVMLLLFLRNYTAAFFVFFIAATNSQLGPTLIHLTGSRMDSISMLTSSLVYVLTISAGIYLTNYYRETLRTQPVQRATWTAVRKALLPCFLSMLTTVLGLVSLCFCQMLPIYNFGRFAAISLVIGTAWLFVTFTAVTQLFPYRRWRWHELTNPTATFQHHLQSLWLAVAKHVRRYRTIIVMICLCLAVFFAIQLPNLKTTVTFHGMFRDNAKVIRDYDTLEERIGGLIPIDVVLTIPAQEDGKTVILNELWFLGEVETELWEEPEIDTVISALNFAPELPTLDSSPIRRIPFERKLASNADRFESIQFLDRIRNEDGSVASSSPSFWRVSLRIPAHSHIDYENMLSGLRTKLDSVVARADQYDLHEVTYLVTGGVPLVHRAQKQLLDDLITSFRYAFLTITLTMVALLRGFVRGLTAMIPNIFPCVIVFGMMAWLAKPIDMGAMMTAGVAIGIAVDGTLHFMTWVRRGIHNGLHYKKAVTYAYEHCSTAMTQTTFICSFGMLIFCMSGFLPIAKFATLLCFLLLTSLVGSLVLLPALLYGPLGKIFQR